MALGAFYALDDLLGASEGFIPQPVENSEMKRYLVALILACWACLAQAQQVMYANVDQLRQEQGDTVSTLRVSHRSVTNVNMMNGGEYRIEARDNSGLNRYLKKRCYAVQMDTMLYVNCRRMHYRRYSMGRCYAPAMRAAGRVFYCTWPVGQEAGSAVTPHDAVRLGGQVGNAIAVSGLLKGRVFYEIDMETGRSSFVGRERMRELLAPWPDKQAELDAEGGESAEVIGRYLYFLKVQAGE